MDGESASDRHRRWTLIVRRSFGIPDTVADHDAREELVRSLEEQLHENGWEAPARAIAQPLVEALMALGRGGDPDDRLLPAMLVFSAATFTSRAAAYRLLESGTRIVDPEQLVFDVASGYPREIIAVAQEALERVSHYLRAESFGT